MMLIGISVIMSAGVTFECAFAVRHCPDMVAFVPVPSRQNSMQNAHTYLIICTVRVHKRRTEQCKLGSFKKEGH